jgi:hypothetical protein
MPRFKVAHIREQGIDLIVVPLESAFGNKTLQDRQDIVTDLQAHASAAGLAGTVVPVWDAGRGRMGCVAPPNWHPYFNGLSLMQISANINREIYW